METNENINSLNGNIYNPENEVKDVLTPNTGGITADTIAVDFQATQRINILSELLKDEVAKGNQQWNVLQKNGMLNSNNIMSLNESENELITNILNSSFENSTEQVAQKENSFNTNLSSENVLKTPNETREQINNENTQGNPKNIEMNNENTQTIQGEIVVNNDSIESIQQNIKENVEYTSSAEQYFGVNNKNAQDVQQVDRINEEDIQEEQQVVKIEGESRQEGQEVAWINEENKQEEQQVVKIEGESGQEGQEVAWINEENKQAEQQVVKIEGENKQEGQDVAWINGEDKQEGQQVNKIDGENEQQIPKLNEENVYNTQQSVETKVEDTKNVQSNSEAEGVLQQDEEIKVQEVQTDNINNQDIVQQENKEEDVNSVQQNEAINKEKQHVQDKKDYRLEKMLFDRINAMQGKIKESIELIQKFERINAKEENLPNIVTTLHDKLTHEVIKQFRTVGIEFNMKSYLVQSVVSDLLGKFGEGITEFKDCSENLNFVREVQDDFESKVELAPTSKVKNIFARLRGMFKPERKQEKLEELERERQKKKLDEANIHLMRYKFINGELEKYTIKDNIVDSLGKEILHGQGSGQNLNVSGFVNEKIAPEMKQLGLEDQIPNLLQRLYNEYKEKDAVITAEEFNNLQVGEIRRNLKNQKVNIVKPDTMPKDKTEEEDEERMVV